MIMLKTNTDLNLIYDLMVQYLLLRIELQFKVVFNGNSKLSKYPIE